MQRNEALLLFEKFMTRAMKSKYWELVKSIYIFGSFSKGSPEPNDIDLLAVFHTEEAVRLRKFGNTLLRDFLGNMQNIDLQVCNEKEFDEFYGFTFLKSDLIPVWPTTNPSPNWQHLIDDTCPINIDYQKNKAFQYHEFQASYPLKCKFQAAVEKQIIHVRELPAEQFYLDRGPWEYEVFEFDESNHTIRNTTNGYEAFLDQTEYHRNQGVSAQYLKTLKVLYSYLNRNEIELEKDIIFSQYMRRPYRTCLRSDDGRIVFRIYIVDLNDSLFHLNYSRSIKQVVLIPRYKVRSKNNYLYVVERGKNWSLKNLRLLDEIYTKASNDSFPG